MDKNKDKDKTRDITVEILISIRDEIRGLNEKFEHMDERLGRIETDIRAIVSHFERDYMQLATKLGELEGRFTAHIQEGH